MHRTTRTGAGLAICLLTGCGPDAPASKPQGSGTPSAAATTSPPTPEQQEIRAKIDAAGVRIPALQTVFRGRGREIHGFPIARRDALPMWERLRAITEQTGFYPLIIADADWLKDLEAPDPAELLAAAAEYVDAEVWLRKKRELDPDFDDHLERGEWTKDAPSTGFYLLTEDEKIAAPALVMALVPTTRPWEVAAHMGFGGWNACPNPEVHVAIHRYWHERYGAEIVTMSGDVIELRVTRPPQTREAAEALAMEQYLYCGDIVDQGTESLLGLASILKGGQTWFFWWD